MPVFLKGIWTMKDWIIYLLFITTVGFGLLSYGWRGRTEQLTSSNEVLLKKLYRLQYNKDYIMPPCEAQARLRDLGYYNGPIDNIWGPNSEKAYCDWSYNASLIAVKKVVEGK